MTFTLLMSNAITTILVFVHKYLGQWFPTYALQHTGALQDDNYMGRKIYFS